MRTIRALWGASHPGPTVVVTALAVALGLAVGLEPWRLVLLGLAVLCGQVSIGISNDVLDAERDAVVGRTDKPVARGDVGIAAAWTAALIVLALALVLSAPLGWRLLAAHALVLGSAWSYNAGLKRSVASVVPFVVSFGVFPSLATLAAPEPAFAAGWAWIAGGSFGVAVHFTNVLPDLADDARTGVRGLPHRLGARASAVLAALAVTAGAVSALLGPVGGDLGIVRPISWVFFAGVVGVAAVTVVRAVAAPPSRALFRLVMLAALLLAASLVASGSSLAG